MKSYRISDIEIYQRMISSLKKKPKKILEIGCANEASIDFLKKTFPHAEIYGVEYIDWKGKFKKYKNLKQIDFLDLNKDKRVIFMLRIFYANEEPMMIEKNYMSYSEFKDLLNLDLSGLRYPVLKERYNIVPHYTNQTFTAVICDQEEMNLFGLSEPQACVELEFAVYDISNVPIEVGYYLYRGDKYKFNINSIDYLIN